MSSTSTEYITFLSTDTKRSMLKGFVTFLPSFYYFNKHAKTILGSSILHKSSHYSPESSGGLNSGSINRLHHYKELGFRLFLGFLAGWMVSTYVYGLKDLTPSYKDDEKDKILQSVGGREAIEDEDSLQYA